MSDALSIFARVGDARPALHLEDGGVVTFGELAARASAVSLAIAPRRGARVAVVATASVASVVTILGILDSGAVLVPIHPRLTAAERARLVGLAGAEVTLDEAALAELGALAPAPVRAMVNAHAPEDPAAIVFTSGTSGTPKGAVLPRRALLASARASAERLRYADDDAWLLCMPLAHIGGLSILTRALVSARRVALSGAFDPQRVLARVARGDATILSVVPTMLHALLEHDRDGVLARLRVVLLGGAAASDALLDACAARRVRALTTYGLTEACSQVTTQRPRDPAQRVAGSGPALPGTEVAVRDDAGEVVPRGVVGRVAVRGPTMMSGYDGLPSPFDDNGFFDTGDLGALGERGELFVHARRTDLIVTGGENVYPVEIEQALEATGLLRRAVVFGVPDARWGQVVAAALEPADVDAARAVALASVALAPHKRPRRVTTVDAIALNGAGKIDRAAAALRYAPALVDVAVGVRSSPR